MSLENVVQSNYRTLIAKAHSGPDKTPSVIFEWANGRVLLDAEQTNLALIELGKTNHAELVLKINEIFNHSAEYREVRRLTPALGLSGGKLVVYLVLPVAS